ncbi:DedA family protein [Mangrovibrevibacter kandeliae]|uniref:DedA family protein n=1 Tax=Mangrovibrevibacter kandeliae TaxID=2968473 RepID=UPI002118D917|nr:DedA family protein [Aurantimonas sp. CSK15Z-1]MCQ8780705.1 DedA family protein [Aurantimonas sp. CSK15Z-1]
MYDTALFYLEHYGYSVLFGIVFLESTGIPLPGESLVIASGILAGQGTLGIGWVLFFAWLGSTLGDNLGYFVGHRYGRKLVVRYGAKVGLTEERFELVEERYRRSGPALVLIARFILILRQLNGFVAGTMRMHWIRFGLYNAIGAALWVGGYALGAYLFGQALQSFFERDITWILMLGALALALTGCIGTFRYLFAAERKREPADGR